MLVQVCTCTCMCKDCVLVREMALFRRHHNVSWTNVVPPDVHLTEPCWKSFKEHAAHHGYKASHNNSKHI